MVEVKFSPALTWRVSRTAPTAPFVGECDDLNMVMSERTLPRLRALIEDAQSELFNYLIKRDELDEFMDKRGIKIKGFRPNPWPVARRYKVHYKIKLVKPHDLPQVAAR